MADLLKILDLKAGEWIPLCGCYCHRQGFHRNINDFTGLRSTAVNSASKGSHKLTCVPTWSPAHVRRRGYSEPNLIKIHC